MIVCKHIVLITFALLQRVTTDSIQMEWSVPRKLESRLSKASDDSGIQSRGNNIQNGNKKQIMVSQ